MLGLNNNPEFHNILNATFSVVTPNYNMGEYLAETIDSVLTNLRPGDEYFIIDGGSTDDSVEIIRRYESHLAGWVSEKDQGYADALAKGFARSTADFHCWINSGDLFLGGALDEARTRLAATGADMIFGDDLYIDDAGHVLQVSNGYVGNLASFMLYGGWTPLQDACFWRRALYEKVGGINSSVRYAADYDLFLRMSLSGRCCYVPVTFSAFRKHAGQNSTQHWATYLNEREACRHRELLQHAGQEWDSRLLQTYYWWKVRWRARFQGKQFKGYERVGKSIKDIHCYALDEEMQP